MPTMGLKIFSLSAVDSKLSFFAGESDILSVSMADAAYIRVSIRAWIKDAGPWRTFLDGVICAVDIVAGDI